MKKNFFMLAATAALFAACAETELVNEVNVESNSQEIGFSTYAGKVTRAENNPKDYKWNLEEHHNDFTVYAGKEVQGSTQAVYSNANKGTVTYGTAWVASPLKYWDKTAAKYYFYAGAPANDNWVFAMTEDENYATGYLKYAGFTLVGENIADGSAVHYNNWKDNRTANDIDLMIAEPCTVDRTAYNKATAEVVNLQFNHILSRLSIKVKKGDNIASTQNLELVSLDIFNMMNQGNFNEDNEEADGSPKNSRWTDATVVNTYVLSGVKLPNVTSNAVYTHQYLVIPQTVSNEELDTNGEGAKTQAYFRIEYKIDDEVYYAFYNLAKAFGHSTVLNFNEGWENTLTITINPAVIEFDAEVSEWAYDTVKGSEVN